MHRSPRSTVLLLLVAVAALTAFAPAAGAAAPRFVKAPGFGAPPASGDCLTSTSKTGCIYDVRLTDFSLSSHVLHEGGTLSASARSDWKEQVPKIFAPGLKLVKKKITPAVGFSASWKVTAPTKSWQFNTIGILIQVPGSAPYLESDYYGVVAKNDAVLEGYVLDKDKLPVNDVDVLIDGLGSVAGENFFATTGNDGYYSATLKAGTYKVCVRQLTKTGGRGAQVCSHSSIVDPGSRAVLVRKKKTARQDFAVQRSSHVEVTLDPATVPANGMTPSKLTVKTLDRWGKPLAGQSVVLSPNVKGTPAQDLTPPALVCDGKGSTVWPLDNPGTANGATDPVNVTTDATGTYVATVFGGTTAGSWTISGRNTTTVGPLGYASATLAIAGQSAVPLDQLHTYVADGIANGTVPTVASFGGGGDITALERWVTALRALGFWQGVEIASVQTPNNTQAILIYPQASLSLDETTGMMTGDFSQARVLEVADPNGTAQQNIAQGGPVDAFPMGWKASDWLAGSTPGVTFRAETSATLNSRPSKNGRRFGGWPYPVPAVQTACG